jgi:hypothetical protein
VHKTQHSPQKLQGDLVTPSKNSSLLTERRKVVIGTKTRSLQRVTYPAHPPLRNTAGAPGGKKPATGTQEIKNITKNNSRGINLNTE